MSDFLASLWFFVTEFVRAPFDALSGNTHRHYVVSVAVNAPKVTTWSIASAHAIRLEGTPPIEIATKPDSSRPGVYTGTLMMPNRSLAIAYRVIEDREGEAMTLQILKDESAPQVCPGDDYVCAVAVAGDDTASTLTAAYDITHTRFASRLILPIAVLQNVRRIRYNAELKAGTAARTGSDQVKNAAITGLLTFGSFSALFGASDAAVLILLILIHELGHVIAMKWVGIPVRGIYFIPFFGGVAVGSNAAKTEAERGLVALMGPAFSIITTVLFLALSAQSKDPLLRNLAIMSAILNGFNLLPIVPLDGGNVARALLSRSNPGVTKVFQFAGLCAGGAIAVFTGDYVLLAIFSLVATSILRSTPVANAPTLAPIDRQAGFLLLMAYLATTLFYIAVIARFAWKA